MFRENDFKSAIAHTRVPDTSQVSRWEPTKSCNLPSQHQSNESQALRSPCQQIKSQMIERVKGDEHRDFLQRIELRRAAVVELITTLMRCTHESAKSLQRTFSVLKVPFGATHYLKLRVDVTAPLAHGLKLVDPRRLGENVQSALFDVKIDVGLEHVGRVGNVGHDIQRL